MTRVPGLSVCCLTSGEPFMVATMLRFFRDVADEIVVAVDSRVEQGTLQPLVDVADRLVRFDFVHPPERARPWVVQLCRHETVLMIDGDEVPSSALLERLPELLTDDQPVQFRVARRWCFPDERSWLAERPWWPDYQYRLVRQGAHLDFDLRVHGGVRAALPARYVDEPLYHLACVQVPFVERRARVRLYEATRPGMVAVGGGPMNDTLYIPEHFATLRPRSTPAEDIVRLREVIGAAGVSEMGAGPTPDLASASIQEIVEQQPTDPIEQQGYSATLIVSELDLRTEPGNDTMIAVEVTNTGSGPIPYRDSPGVQIRLAARLSASENGSIALGWTLSPLPCDIPAGESRTAEVLVRVPVRAGNYLLDVDLINERGRWFQCIVRANMLVSTRWGRYSPGSV